MLLLEGLLNFSRDILPSNRGGQMDAPLVLTTQLLPSQIDKEALNVDCSWMYSTEFYEATTSQLHPSEVNTLSTWLKTEFELWGMSVVLAGHMIRQAFLRDRQILNIKF